MRSGTSGSSSSLANTPGGALVIAPDTEGAAEWARRLDAARLDSGASPGSGAPRGSPPRAAGRAWWSAHAARCSCR